MKKQEKHSIFIDNKYIDELLKIKYQKGFEDGLKERTNVILEMIDREILDQQNLMLNEKENPNQKYNKSIEWRIVGLEELKRKIRQLK